MNDLTFKKEAKKLKQVEEKLEEEKEYLNKSLVSNANLYSKEDYTRAHLIYMGEKRLKEIEKIKSKPYFARLDFKEKENTEELYIGKLSIIDKDTHIPIVIDWRTPIANLYYDGRVGKASYECLDGTIEGEILLKRQFIIENGKLERYSDIDLTTNDELLQQALGQNADSRLKNIVATIQEEQNKIIRADMFKPLVIQGVAGSGKTTIALHRIAYLIYNHEQEFNPEEFMIIAPNKFFLNYISNILPDLGVENVKQCTFEEFASETIGKKLKISDENEKLVKIVNNESKDIDTKILIQESKFKSSIQFKKIIDQYLEKIEKDLLPKEDFVIEGYTVMKYEELQNLFLNTYLDDCIADRILKIKRDLIFNLRQHSQNIINKIKEERTKSIQRLYLANLTEEEIQKNRVKIFEEKENILKLLEEKIEKIAEMYTKNIKLYDGVYYYTDFIKNYVGTLDIEKNLKDYLIENTYSNLKKNSITYEDLAPILYLQYRIKGISSKERLKHVVIDEAQDYGEFQFDVLKTILNSNSLTILGDIYQGVHYYRGIENWGHFIDVEFGKDIAEFRVLSKTYRTTKEIMNVANNVLMKLPEYERENIVLGEPVIDIKDCVTYNKCENLKEIIAKVNEKIDKYIKEKYKSIAIIGKDKKECEYIYKELSKIRKDINLIQSKDSNYEAGINIVPSYLAKGLEFDCVIVFNANEEKYKENSLDIKILYVVLTRAMSKLDICYLNNVTKLLE